MLSPWLSFYLIHKIICSRLLPGWRVSNKRFIHGRMLHIYVLKFRLVLGALRVPGPSCLIILCTSLASLTILLIPDVVVGRFIITRKLWSLSRNFMCMTCISYNLKSSYPMIPFCKRAHVNTETLSIQSGLKLFLANICLQTIIFSQSHKMWKLKTCSTRL